ncbi:MAG: lipoate--protein ligase [Chloroflexi bacterium]|nr:lipoate--protein ligase [Chloroflexota bacterium]
MLYIDNPTNNDPRLNLALEEYVLRHVPTEEPILLFYVNAPAVIIGRNQNTLEEIDPDYVREQGIHVVRRLSGGGAVYHDLGNLNFSFATSGRENFHNFGRFTAPVTAVLNKLGLPAQLHGTSDIFVHGKKISGNAQYATSQRMFSHGTILVNTDLGEMLKALNPRQVQIESKAVQSIRNFVANVTDFVPELTLAQLREAILEEIFGAGGVQEYPLTAADWQAIHQLAAERYGAWEWNYGASPKFNVQKSGQLGAVKYDVRLWVERGLVQELSLFGNFPSRREMSELTSSLVGVRYEPEALAAVLAQHTLTDYVGTVSQEELVGLLY